MTGATPYYIAGIGIYLAFITAIFVRAWLAQRRADRTIAFEALGTRKFAAPLIAVLIAEAMLGPSDALTLSQNGLLYGAAWAIFPLGAALAQAVTGLFFVRRIYDSYPGRLSVGDIFAERCGLSSRGFVGLVVFAQAVAFSGVLVLAGGQVFESLLGVERIYGMALTAFVVGTYTALGGINVVVDTNKLQAVFAWSIMVLALVSTVYLLGSGDAIPSDVLIKEDFFEEHSLKVGIGLFVAYFMGEMLLPAYAVRGLMAKSAGAAQLGFLLAAGLLTLWYLVVTTAGAAGALVPSVARGSTDNVILLDIVRVMLPPATPIWYVAGALVAAGLLALIHSTFNAFLNSGAVALARDVVGIVQPDVRIQGAVERWTVMGIAILGIFVAMSGDSLIGVLLIGYTIWVPSLLAPFIWILLNPAQRLHTLAFWSAVIAGALGWALFEYVIVSPMPGILAGFLCNGAALLITQTVKGQAPLAASQ